MFNLGYSTPCELKGVIVFNKQPSNLGVHVDIDGNKWDIKGIFGNAYVWACPLNELHPYYSDTSGQSFGLVQQSWKPYGLLIE